MMVYNRTQADVAAAAALIARYQQGDWAALTEQERAQLERGTYTYTTLNRVEQAQADLARILQNYGYNIAITTKIWNAGGYFNEAELLRYLGNLNTLRTIVTTSHDTPPTPGDFRPITAANAIEKILSDMEQLVNNMAAAFQLCGQIYSGEV